jgi:predicted nucleic acid-binding protein
MIYVVDASVALKWVLSEQDSDRARRLRLEFLAGQHDLIAPDIFLSEVGHALVKATRRRLITSLESTVFLADVMVSLPTLEPVIPLVTRAHAIALSTGIGLYGAL